MVSTTYTSTMTRGGRENEENDGGRSSYVLEKSGELVVSLRWAPHRIERREVDITVQKTNNRTLVNSRPFFPPNTVINETLRGLLCSRYGPSEWIRLTRNEQKRRTERGGRAGKSGISTCFGDSGDRA